MSKPAEEAASRAFLEALMRGVQDEASRKEVEYMVEELFPVLIPGIVHLLKARAENQRRLREEASEEEDETTLPIQPLDHLARYLLRHNPRHCEPPFNAPCLRVARVSMVAQTVETTEMQALARKMLRK